MDKQKVVDAILVARNATNECNIKWLNSDELLGHILKLVGDILIADAIEGLKPPPFPFGSLRAESRYAVGVDMGVKDDDMAEFTHDFDVITNEDLLKEAVKRGLITLGE